jgi:hypothetical protein
VGFDGGILCPNTLYSITLILGHFLSLLLHAHAWRECRNFSEFCAPILATVGAPSFAYIFFLTIEYENALEILKYTRSR